jgi:hypothetical protein
MLAEGGRMFLFAACLVSSFARKKRNHHGPTRPANRPAKPKPFGALHYKLCGHEYRSKRCFGSWRIACNGSCA